jgi:HEAT repeat protein
MNRVSSFLCGGLLFGLLASLASGQTPTVQPEIFTCTRSAISALPRLIGELKSPDAKVRAKAIATLGSLGPIAKSATPALIETAVNTTDHAAALQALVKIDDEATRAALRQLLVGRVGRCRCGKTIDFVVASAGEPVAPQLLVLLPEKERTAEVERVLAQIGAPAVPHMLKTLGDGAPEATQLSIYRTLAAMGPAAKSAVPALELPRRCEPESVQIQRAYALIRIIGDHPPSFVVLHNAIKNGDQATKLQALACLRASGIKAKELVPTLVSLMVADDAAYHTDASQTLINIGPDAVPALIESITTDGCRRFNRNLFTRIGKEQPKHTERVVQTLHRMGPGAAAAIEVFMQLVEGHGPLAVYAADALPDFGPQAKRAVPSLLDALRADSVNLRLSSANALARIDRQQVGHTIPVLVVVMHGKNANEKERAMWLLASLGADGKAAVPALLAMLNDGSLQARLRIAEALSRIDPSAMGPAMPTLLDALHNNRDAATAVRLLGQIGPQAKSAVPALKMLLAASLKNDSAPVNPRSIMLCLKKIDASADIMPILIDGLNSADPDQREDAAHLVQQMRGPQTLASLNAAIANGQLATSAEVTDLLKTLRPQTPGAGQ